MRKRKGEKKNAKEEIQFAESCADVLEERVVEELHDRAQRGDDGERDGDNNGAEQRAEFRG